MYTRIHVYVFNSCMKEAFFLDDFFFILHIKKQKKNLLGLIWGMPFSYFLYLYPAVYVFIILVA